jgi:hypothetical protein
MGKKLPPMEMELYRRCDEVLHYIWDPIGVAGHPGARDEYWDYFPHMFQMLLDGEPRNKLVEYLHAVETEAMCLSGSRPGAEEAVGFLFEWKEWLARKYKDNGVGSADGS